MESKQLMIGDWVILNYEGVKKIVQIIRLNQHYCDVLTDNGNEINSVAYSLLEGLELTEEILKANGLLVDKNVIEKDDKYGDDSIIYIAKTGIYIKDEVETHWNVSVRIHETHIGDGVIFYMKFHYVHELQHALRLCGLNDWLIISS